MLAYTEIHYLINILGIYDGTRSLITFEIKILQFKILIFLWYFDL